MSQTKLPIRSTYLKENSSYYNDQQLGLMYISDFAENLQDNGGRLPISQLTRNSAESNEPENDQIGINAILQSDEFIISYDSTDNEIYISLAK